METFVLTAGDNDSIMAGKVYIHHHPEATHLSASRTSRNLPEGSTLVFVRPYLKLREFIGERGYCASHKIVLFHYVDSELYEQRDVLASVGCTCIWVPTAEALCTAMWTYLHHNEEYPDIVKYIRDYMKWDLVYEQSIHIHYGLSIHPNKFTYESSEFYIRLLNGDAALMDQLICDGIDITSYLHRIWDFLARELIFDTDLAHMSVLAANIPGANSQFFNHRILSLDYDLALTFGVNNPSGNIRHTLYQLSPEVRVDLIAKTFGGGGVPGVGSFVSPKLEVSCKGCEQQVYDHTLLLGPAELRESVLRYIQLNLLVKPYDVLSGFYMGRKAFIANTPHLTHTNQFANVQVYDEELGVTYCLQGSGMYRIATIELNGNDPGELYGTKCGNYRIAIKPVLDGMLGESLRPDILG